VRLDNLLFNDNEPLPQEERIQCTACKSSDFFHSFECESLITCSNCGIQVETFKNNNLHFGDLKRFNLAQKTMSDKRNHFIDCFNQYQGRCKNGLPGDMLVLIEEKLDHYKLIDHAQTTRENQYSKVTKEHIKIVLKDLRLSREMYENINYIFSLVAGKPVRNIEYLREKVLHDFDLFNEAYIKKYPNFAAKTYKYQQLLYQFLRRHGCKCDPSDFNFLKTTERKARHDEIYSSLFEDLGWNYISLF
jgi:hypothetical protein